MNMETTYFTGNTKHVCPQCVKVWFNIVINGKKSKDLFYRRPALTDWSRKYGYPHEHEDIFIPYATDWIKHDVVSRHLHGKTQEERDKIQKEVSIEIVRCEYDDLFN